MIQLATETSAARLGWPPAAAAPQEANPLARKGRSGHAWPFISRQPERPAGAQPARREPSNHGS
jgi:hypothetical protein